ncbi:CoA transferase [Phytohabitans sp. ZYX-F-186]|uniref:CoA transferase n=1 Tax=Phytohabitans maris TaxID=3071409 RepID=A0ABU0ZA38_9ACTN|nr:CoA transferase [Phytohabitans sp. ZYX-F-186]MDQ7903899.1 CoA transferase [Phytohabitans sp. ZYX-F-186]
MTETTPALSGLRVLDATTGIAGPVATMLLGDLGGQVIRVEGGWPDSGTHLPGAVMWHRNKTIVPAAQGLVATADLVVTSHPEVAAALGVPVDREPPAGLVHLHLPPLRPDATLDPLAQDRLAQAEYGIARRQTSFSGGPVDGIYPFCSYLQGAWGATAAIAALTERVRTGLGQTVTVDALHGAMVAATTTMFADPAVTLPSTTVGPGGPNPAFGTYRCADGAWLFLGALGIKYQDIAFELLGTTDITADPEIAANRELIYAPDRRDRVRARIAEGFRRKARAEWLAEFAAAGCPASAVADRDAWLDHPQVAALGQRVELDDPVVGPAVMGGVPVELSGDPRPALSPRRFAGTAGWADDRPAHAAAATAGQPRAGGGPLAGVRVLDLGTVLAGPYAGMLLAALGADVVKVETLKGDEFRVRGYMINRGQRGLSIDLRNPGGLAAFRRLVSASDVVLDNFRPGVRGRLGIDHETLRADNPDLVSTSITGYGGTGPLGDHPGYDPVVQAMSGIMKAQGGDAEPVFSTVAVNDVTVACLAALGTCAALYQRATGRGGQSVHASLAVSATFMQSNELVRYEGRVPAETGGRDHPGPSALSRYYACADGWVRLHLPSAGVAVRAGLASAGTGHDGLAQAVGAALADLPSEKIVELVEAAGGTAAPARDNKGLLFDPAVLADGHVTRYVWPDGNQSYLPHRYAVFSRHPERPVLTTPGLGEHSRQVLAEAGLASATVDDLIAAGVVFQGEPLHSVAGTGYR